ERATVEEDRVGDLQPVVDRAVGVDAPDLSGCRADLAPGGAQHAVGDEGEAGDGRGELGERRDSAGGRVVAFDALVEVLADEHRSGRVDGDVLDEVPGDHDA